MSHRVLIVEDHALVAKFYRIALERAGGFECTVTEDMAEILSRVDAGEVDVAILDVSLSATHHQGVLLDGVALTRLLKQRAAQRGRPLPILLATAHAMAGDRERLMTASGADDYLEKPVYDAQMLVEKVRHLVEGKAESS
ncbi:MAG TPA: response regulator [Candidatus Acidoferrales bacterium]